MKQTNITNFGGHSGCIIQLVEEQNRTYVRKTSSSIEYNERLQKQADKQNNYKNDCIKVPKVLKTGFDDNNLFYFDMEYIQGVTLSKYIESVEISEIKNLVKDIVDSIIAISKESANCEEVFINKIQVLKQKLGNKNKIVNEAVSLLERHNWNKFTKTQCHGDLTLENIIVKNGQIYLIDFLDSFYDSWILDAATLMQDVQTMWSYRFEEKVNINRTLRLIVFRDLLLDRIKEKDESYIIEVYYALLLKLIRIYPYTNDEETLNFLNLKTKSIIEIIKGLECEH